MSETDKEKTSKLEDILQKIEKRDERNTDTARLTGASRDKEDKQSLKKFRENLLAFEWAKDDVYRISLKFFKERTAKELDAQFQKLLNSLHFFESPRENHDLALKVLLNEMTSTEAIKKSLLRKNAADLRKALKAQEWASGYVDQLVTKYAGEKTIEDLIAKYSLIVSELPYDSSPKENNALAIKVLLDWANYDQVYQEAAKIKYRKEVKRAFPDLPEDSIGRLTNSFFGKSTVSDLRDKCGALNEKIKIGAYPKDMMLAVRVVLSEMTEDDARGEVRRMKNMDDIMRLAKDLALDSDIVTKLSDKFGRNSLTWFDTEFPEMFSSLASYTGSERPNALLAIRVLAGQMDRGAAIAEARCGKNKEDIIESANNIMLPDSYVTSLLDRYGKPGIADMFDQDFARVMATLKSYPDSEKMNGLLAVRVLLGELTEENAAKMSELVQVFNKYELPENVIDEIAAKYMGRKTPEEIVFAFESILEKLPVLESKEENYGIAIDVLLDGSPDSLDRAVNTATIKKDKGELQRSLNSYGWFSGYASELLDKYFQKKSGPQIIELFERTLAELAYSEKPTENYDLGIRVLLEKMSLDEAKREADLRKELRSVDCTREFAVEIAGKYLGSRPVTEVVEFFTQRLAERKFWKGDSILHRYAVEMVLRELNGQLGHSIVQLATELLDLEVSVSHVKTVTSIFEKKGDNVFDPAEVVKIYNGFLQSEGEKGKAADKFISSLG